MDEYREFSSILYHATYHPYEHPLIANFTRRDDYTIARVQCHEGRGASTNSQGKYLVKGTKFSWSSNFVSSMTNISGLQQALILGSLQIYKLLIHCDRLHFVLCAQSEGTAEVACISLIDPNDALTTLIGYHAGGSYCTIGVIEFRILKLGFMNRSMWLPAWVESQISTRHH